MADSRYVVIQPSTTCVDLSNVNSPAHTFTEELVAFYVNVTALTGGTGAVVVQARDPLSGNWVSIPTFATGTISAIGLYRMPTGAQILQDIEVRAQSAAAGGNMTYTVTAVAKSYN